MGEVLFYHLTRAPLIETLYTLLDKSLSRGWRAVVQTGMADRLDDLDLALWTSRKEGFLPHGTASMGMETEQPVFLTAGTERPNQPNLVFLVEGAAFDPTEVSGLDRMCLLFNGHDPEETEAARASWRAATAAGLTATYWAEGERGWEKKASNG
ncbi:DNA polymerase III subunit chi [Paracoccaceae bacterium GXU_MW_L88]